MSDSFTSAWLADDPRATALLPRAVADPEARREAVTRAASRVIDPAVLSALERRYAGDERPGHSHRRAQLARLAAGGAACVVTGQQAGLFGGPLYSVHKAASAIRLAERLEAETGVPCIPIFWLQSEDHDFDEIATTYTLGDGLVPLTVTGDPADADRAVADRALGPSVAPALDALADALSGLGGADEVMALWRSCYQAEASPTAAFRALIEAAFDPWGLLVLDPRDPEAPELARAAASVHRRAIEGAASIAEALTARAAALESAGFAVQVHVRPAAPLSFWHTAEAGPRQRLEPAGAAPSQHGFETCTSPPRPVTWDAVMAALEQTPRQFSTSALLRPILQDTWLPTAAYVGGPGEIAYFAQMPPVYAAFGLPVPLIVHRCRLRIIDSTADRLLDQLGLDADGLEAPRHALLTAVGGDGGSHPDPDALEAALVEPVAEAIAGFRPHAEALDKGLSKMVDKTAETLSDVARRLVDRYRRTLARNDEVTVQRLDRVLARLQPAGGPQERTLGLPWFAARYGLEPLVKAVVALADPADDIGPGLRDLRP